MDFQYKLEGFRKSGTRSFNEWFTLIFIMDTFWYGFKIDNYSEPEIIKKMYHQPMTQNDIETIVEALVNKVLDKMEWMIEQIEKQ